LRHFAQRVSWPSKQFALHEQRTEAQKSDTFSRETIFFLVIEFQSINTNLVYPDVYLIRKGRKQRRTNTMVVLSLQIMPLDLSISAIK
jgi:hypothetical protein